MTDTTHPAGSNLDSDLTLLWLEWLAATAACHAASGSDPQADLATHGRAELLALQLAAIPATTLDDTRPKVVMAAWHRQFGVSTDVDDALEAAIEDDLLRLQPPLDPPLD